ncbi:MAG: hypothetical protein ACLU84_07450 [Clostridia bacterium]
MEEKKRNWWKWAVIFVIIMMILVYMVMIGRKWVILNKVYQEACVYNEKTNFYERVIHYSGTSTIIEDIYRKENKQYKKTTYLGSNNEQKEYIDGEERISINSNEKIATIQNVKEEMYMPLVENLLISKDTFNRLGQAIQCTIKEEKCNGVVCYLIDFGDDYKIWVDKENNLIVREANGSYINENGEEYSSIRDIKYKLGTVTDEEVKSPELTEEYSIRTIE